ncbi:hypothetical protein EB796_001062 [Bugula neritina]|uniref:B box-type domain-containing protein n=1 Tax=Bugula neritina TaxID=10212 RepID=A0A7J7KR80_BUGNE|nr:hypothetical protein EB796_001062 [Bugula neritina]
MDSIVQVLLLLSSCKQLILLAIRYGLYEYLDVAKIPLSSPRSVNGAAAASPLADPRDPQTEIQQLANALQLDSKTEVCQSENCEKEIDGFCTKCNQLICYRCSKKTKCSMDGEHEFADIDQYKAAKQAMYDMWYTGKKNHTIAMDQEMRALALFVQKEAARLANDSLSGIVSSLSKTIATLTNKQNEIRTLSHKLSEVRSVVTYYTDNIGKLSSPGFVKLVNTLVMPESGKVKKYNVGRVDSLVAKSCEYMGTNQRQEHDS